MTTNATILLVDDELELVEAYATMLEGSYTVRTATSGEEALRKLNDSVDVVLLDRRMPDQSGDAVLHEIRDRGYDCRVVMISAVEPDADTVDMEFDEYLVKPVTRVEILNTIEDLLVEKDRAFQVQEPSILASEETLRVFLDTNIFIASLTDEPGRGDIATDVMNRDSEFATSILNLMELRTVLTKKKNVEQVRVEEILTDVSERLWIYTPDDEDLIEAYDLQRETLLYPMDCIFLALARDLDAQPVTFDRELIDAGAIPPEKLL